MISNLVRDDEAVSAAVATVLLFGGVVSIIGLMLVSMVPIIEELEGSIERDDMTSQMIILAQETEYLSEHGMPGDSTEVEITTLDGDLSWDSTRGGMWYSSTWNDQTSFRLKGVLDFDDSIEIKHPESKTKAVCFDDLRLGPTRPFIYSIPLWSEELTISISQGIAAPLGPANIEIYSQQTLLQRNQLEIFDILTIDASSYTDARIESSHQLTIFSSAGIGGATFVEPDSKSPTNGMGRTWTIPMNSGVSNVQILSNTDNRITVENGSLESTYFALGDNNPRTGVGWEKYFDLSSPRLVKISTSAPSKLILFTDNTSSSGAITLSSSQGALVGKEFITPLSAGTLEIFNVEQSSAAVTWYGGTISVPGNGSIELSWPPQGADSPVIIDSDKSISVTWHNNDISSQRLGVNSVSAIDTGASSGSRHSIFVDGSSGQNQALIQASGYHTSYNITADSVITNGSVNFSTMQNLAPLTSDRTDIDVIDGHALRVYSVRGESGLTQLLHDGEQRCVSIDITASGWITTTLPWNNIAGRDDVSIENAWREGSHPTSYSITLVGEHQGTEYATLASAWIFHISRLTYSFTSSITGMEVAYSNGAVVTNHPEFLPTILREPNDRSGPGPRFAATIPALHPTFDSVTGGGKLTLDIELSYRDSLASQTAYEVRRGWSNPYGEAIANSVASGLDSSLDWTIYPGRLDLLTDYVGWVPDPSIGTAEAVWHTNNQPIEFSLQLSSLDVTMMEAVG